MVIGKLPRFRIKYAQEGACRRADKEKKADEEDEEVSGDEESDRWTTGRLPTWVLRWPD